MRKLTIEEMQELAESKGGKCLSPVYVHIHDYLEWQCANGHRWKALPSSIRQGRWCARCVADRRKNTLDEMRKLATAKSGRCLSMQYVNYQTPLEWECSAGHVWRARPNGIKQGSWCLECAGKIRTIEDMRHLAESRGGKCLSPQYINTYTKLEWECAEGHRWWAKPNSIQQGKWCPTCSGNAKKTIEEMRLLAQSRGGKCLSNRFVNVITKLQWECAQGHRWWTNPSNVLRGHWCPKCAGLDKKTVTEMTLLAQEQGGAGGD